MPIFAYKGIDTSGSGVSGTLTADTPASGRQLLRRQGVRLVEYRPTTLRRRGGVGSPLRRSRRQEQVSEFARQLSMLLSTDAPLVEALDVLVRQQSGKFAMVLQDVREKVAGGSSLGEALAAHPQWFDNIFRSAVEVGQTSGQMDASLAGLASFIRERQTLKTRLLAALAYPMILAVIATGVVLFLMSYVVPQLLTVLAASGRALPVSTLLLKRGSDTLTQHWLLLLAGVLCCALIGAACYRWPKGRLSFHRLALRTPLLGILIRKGITAQFAQMMSLLLRSGVPFIDSVRLARGNTRNLVLEGELRAMESAIQRGSDIAPTLEHSRIFPPLMVHIVNVGQKTGEMTEMLAQLRDGYETEVRLAIGKFAATLEPAMIVVMSLVVGFVVFATMMPILEVTKVIQ